MNKVSLASPRLAPLRPLASSGRTCRPRPHLAMNASCSSIPPASLQLHSTLHRTCNPPRHATLRLPLVAACSGGVIYRSVDHLALLSRPSANMTRPSTSAYRVSMRRGTVRGRRRTGTRHDWPAQPQGWVEVARCRGTIDGLELKGHGVIGPPYRLYILERVVRSRGTGVEVIDTRARTTSSVLDLHFFHVIY